MIASWLSAIAVLLATGGLPVDDETAWRYVVPRPGELHEHPPQRAIALSAERPQDLQEAAKHRGPERRYAQLRFGNEGSVRVAVVVDLVAPGDADLYVDANRNRTIEPEERVAGEGRTWRLPLDALIAENPEPRFVRRQVRFELGSSGRTLSVAVLGYLAGTVQLGDRQVAARRMDADGNGLFTDPQDRLWLDLNGDGRWDAGTEQFLFAPTLTLDDQRYVVRSDAAGTWLHFSPLEGTGRIRLSLSSGDSESDSSNSGVRPAPRVLELTARFVGRDGSVMTLDGTTTELTVPVGEYRLSSLKLSLADAAGGPAWNFLFTENGRRGEATYHHVAKDAIVAIDAIGTLELLTGLESERTCRPGPLTVQPRLYTAEGLQLVTAFRGRQDLLYAFKGPGARTLLSTTDGTPLDETQSGFV